MENIECLCTKLTYPYANIHSKFKKRPLKINGIDYKSLNCWKQLKRGGMCSK